MTKQAISLVIATLATTVVAAGSGATWISKEFKDSWNDPTHGAADYLNSECQPAGLDGIQVFAVQKGHGSSFNLHLSCRQDKSTNAHYSVRMLDVPRGHLDETFTPYLGNPHVRIGPFYFGKVDAPDGTDGILLIEKVR